ncbi:hypothetical protein LTR84_012228 [Exophiala bonariae]|uniref:Uncharacterized protein n=1 Tax=Exophiala bonariae TaxID=1690606 RepID=A0AAV9NJ99_9EURO|nr:hypothetical protein LTR84_012228 [Exophiala bonariae]
MASNMACINPQFGAFPQGSLTLLKTGLDLPNVIDHYRQQAVERVHILPIPPNRLPWLAPKIKSGQNVFIRNMNNIFIYYETACKRLALSGHTSKAEELENHKLQLKAVVDGLSSKMISELQGLEQQIEPLNGHCYDSNNLACSLTEAVLISHLDIDAALAEEEFETADVDDLQVVAGAISAQVSGNFGIPVTKGSEVSAKIDFSEHLTAANTSTALESSNEDIPNSGAEEPEDSSTDQITTDQNTRANLKRPFDDVDSCSSDDGVLEIDTDPASDGELEADGEEVTDDKAETTIITEALEDEEATEQSEESGENEETEQTGETEEHPSPQGTDLSEETETAEEVPAQQEDADLTGGSAPQIEIEVENTEESGEEDILEEPVSSHHTHTPASSTSSAGKNVETPSKRLTVDNLLWASPASQEDLEFLSDVQAAEDFLASTSDEDCEHYVIKVGALPTESSEVILETTEQAEQAPIIQIEQNPPFEESTLLEDGEGEEKTEPEAINGENDEDMETQLNSMPGAYPTKPFERESPGLSVLKVFGAASVFGIPFSIVYPITTAVLLYGMIRFVRSHR